MISQDIKMRLLYKLIANPEIDISKFSLQFLHQPSNIRVSIRVLNNTQREWTSQGCQGSVVFPRGGNKPNKHSAVAMPSEYLDPLICRGYEKRWPHLWPDILGSGQNKWSGDQVKHVHHKWKHQRSEAAVKCHVCGENCDFIVSGTQGCTNTHTLTHS